MAYRDREKQRETRRAYYAKNKDKIKAQVKKYCVKNKDKIKAYRKNYYEQNKDEFKSRSAKYRADNKDKIKEYGDKYRADKKDKIKARGKAYYKNNREKILAQKVIYGKKNKDSKFNYNKKYYAKNKDKIAISSYVSRYNKRWDRLGQLYIEQGKKCNGCDLKLPFTLLEADHTIPKSKGGADNIDNIQLLCPRCNKIKNRHMSQDDLKQRLLLVGIIDENGNNIEDYS